MRRLNKKNKMYKRAQSLLEYSVVLGVVVSVFFAMQTYVKRSIQAGIKISADQLGTQEEGLPEANPREDMVQTGSSSSNPSIPTDTQRTYTVSPGGNSRAGVSENRSGIGDSKSESKDDGWYYMPDTWELHRKVE